MIRTGSVELGAPCRFRWFNSFRNCRFSLSGKLSSPLKPTPEENQRHFSRATEAMKAFSAQTTEFYNVVSFSRNVVLSGLSFSLNVGLEMSDVVGSSRLCSQFGTARETGNVRARSANVFAVDRCDTLPLLGKGPGSDC
jgi:hypothetical protein